MIYKCFVASPSDVMDERLAVKAVVEQLNKRLLPGGKHSVATVMWEENSYPAIGSDAQSVINDQLAPGDCPIFIAIFGGRIGTSTPRGSSGTVEEFEQAYNSWCEKGHKIHIFFKKNINISVNDVDVEQIKRLQEFKKDLQTKGALYRDFEDIDELKSVLDLALSRDISEIEGQDYSSVNIGDRDESDKVGRILENRLNVSLEALGRKPEVWIRRRLCYSSSMPSNLVWEGEGVLSDRELIDKEECFVINAPAQFGLTSLAHYLILEAWKIGRKWAYLDLKAVKLRKVESALSEEKLLLGCNEFDCIIIDSWIASHPHAQKLFECLDEKYPASRIILMQTHPETIALPRPMQFKSIREFVALELLPLRKEDVRQIVSSFSNGYGCSRDEMLDKIIRELESLNIHRTPINCCTLLTVAEKSFSDAPINRAVMLDQVLFVLFNLHDIPTYSVKPDVKDCEFLLGYLAEWIIRESKDSFSERDFESKAREYCEKYLVDVDVGCLFKILVNNKILIKVWGTVYRFCATFWVYYFAAHRMSSDVGFAKYILEDHRYAQYPDIIEFYTGLSRDKSDILALLCDDLDKTKAEMYDKIGIKHNLNPLRLLKWAGSEKDLARMKASLSDDIKNSSLPSEIKDRHADSKYQYLSPYDQSIDRYIESVSYHLFEKQLQTLSRALRNSDFADVQLRKRAIKLIVSSWQEISKILFIIAPALTVGGNAVFGGTRFLLDESWDQVKAKNDRQLLFTSILRSIPLNVVSATMNDVASQKIAKLFYYILDDSPSDLVRHLVMRYLICQRPNGWRDKVFSYIGQIGERSFYQSDVRFALKSVMMYDNLMPNDKNYVKELYVESTAKFTGTSKALLIDRIKSNGNGVE